MQQRKLPPQGVGVDLHPEVLESHTELEHQGCVAVGLTETERFQEEKKNQQR